MKNLSIEEFLEVPELKYNRITATRNEFWVTDAGVIDDVLDDDDGIFLITLKEKPGEPTHEAGAEASSLDYAPQEGGRRSQVTINFQYKDMEHLTLSALFWTENDNSPIFSHRFRQCQNVSKMGAETNNL